MSDRRTPKSDSVQIRLDMRAALIGGGIVAALLIFLAAFAIGRMLNQPAQTAVQTAPSAPGAAPNALPQAQQPGVQLPNQQQQQPQVLQGKPSDTPVPVPAVRAPAGAEMPIGDNPRLAIPDLKGTGYIYDFGEIAPTQKVEKVITLKNDGTKPLEIKDVKST